MKIGRWILLGCWFSAMMPATGCGESEETVTVDGTTGTDTTGYADPVVDTIADSGAGSGNDPDTLTEPGPDPEIPLVSQMPECDGGRRDPETDLCWQDPPPADLLNWYRAAGVPDTEQNPDGEDFCGALDHGGHTDWRLPDIGELLSLLRGCRNGVSTGDQIASLCTLTPDGCPQTDTCENGTQCAACPWNEGPGVRCYLDLGLNGPCGYSWSSSTRVHPPPYTSSSANAWIVNFNTGAAYYTDKNRAHPVRCVRTD